MNISGVSSSSSYYASTGNRSERVAASNGETPKQPTDAEKKAGELSPEEANQVAKLKETDRKVRMHEAAHMAAGGGMITSGASYTYQKGPDGVSYATGGEVGIDTSPGRTPDETISRAQRIRAAALAPAEPSGQDIAVAGQATQMEQQARMEKAQEKREAASSQGKVENFYGAKTSDTGSKVSAYA
ncbi:putative metalloprotease CJM1_0395 family protein [Azonexus sp.]|uniref:putative metalloprotease CJM1_0395 family protein n=1 Tax=Azonexus sp. TaxID=1872668 RepID=UPI0027BAB720|nr:putative metalloprotease CJM1_0395 family protein [Azonexus sp.]